MGKPGGWCHAANRHEHSLGSSDSKPTLNPSRTIRKKQLCTFQKKCTICVQFVYNQCTKRVQNVYRKCTASFFCVQKVYIQCTESVQSLFLCTKSVHFMYRKCTASFFCVQKMYNLCTTVHFLVFGDVQERTEVPVQTCTLSGDSAYSFVHCTVFRHLVGTLYCSRLYIPDCTFYCKK